MSADLGDGRLYAGEGRAFGMSGASGEPPVRCLVPVHDGTVILVVGALPHPDDFDVDNSFRILYCGCLEDAYPLARGGPVDLLVVPADIPRGQLRVFRQRFTPTYGVLVYFLESNAGLMATGVALHAEGYMAGSDKLARVVPQVMRGEFPMPPSMRRWLLDHVPVPAYSGSLFTQRETEVLKHLVAGKSNKAIAREIGLTEASAKEYVKRIMWKMNVSNRTEAAVRILRDGLVL